MITITLPSYIAEPLSEQAHRRGMTPEQLAIETLRTTFTWEDTQDVPPKETLFDFLSGYIGTIDGAAEPLSRNTGRLFADSPEDSPYSFPRWTMTLHELLIDIHTLEENLLELERKYGLRSETFYAAYSSGEEPEDDAWVLDFSEWASIYRTWLTRLAEYRNEVQRLQGGSSSLKGLIRAVS